LPEDLPREVITHLPAQSCCPDCGGALRQFGEDVSEQLERIPATYKVIQHVRPKFACAACEQVVKAPAPARPIDHGLPGPSLLAQVLVSKFADHQPLYRQSEIYAREGIDLSRSTLAGWVGAASELLAPLVDQIRSHVMAGTKIHADDTPVPVLAPGNGKTKTARLGLTQLVEALRSAAEGDPQQTLRQWLLDTRQRIAVLAAERHDTEEDFPQTALVFDFDKTPIKTAADLLFESIHVR
jgi:transposase